MHIMAARMHDRFFVAVDADLFRSRHIVQPAVFDERQAVHIRAQHQSRPRSIFHHCNDTGAADFFGNGEARSAPLLRDNRGGAGFLIGKFGVLMEIEKQRFQIFVIIRCDRRCQIG